MTTAKKLFDLAQLAEASYANLVSGANLVEELQNNGFGMKFSDTQATALRPFKFPCN